jgi:hypothetical protein
MQVVLLHKRDPPLPGLTVEKHVETNDSPADETELSEYSDPVDGFGADLGGADCGPVGCEAVWDEREREGGGGATEGTAEGILEGASLEGPLHWGGGERFGDQGTEHCGEGEAMVSNGSLRVEVSGITYIRKRQIHCNRLQKVSTAS